MRIVTVITFSVYDRIHVLHQNINGLLLKADELTVSLNNINGNNNLIDVVCITEHNMITEDTKHLQIPNYTIAAIFSRTNRNGGSCILVRNNHKFKILQEAKLASVSNLIECSAIELWEHKLIIICIYRPPKTKRDQIEIFLTV